MRLTRASETLGASTTARQLGELRERHGRLTHQLVDLGRPVEQASWPWPGLRSPGRRFSMQIVDEGAVARVGGHPPRRDVRLHDEAGLLEDGELVSHGRRTAAELVAVHERLAAHRRRAGYVLLDERLQHAASTFVEHARLLECTMFGHRGEDPTALAVKYSECQAA